jgi:membrane protease subunit HflK
MGFNAFKKPNIKISPARALTWLVIVAAAAVLLTGIYKVDGTELAVVTRFGRYNRTMDPGLHFKLPLGIERNYNVPVTTVQTEQFGFETLKSGVVNQYKNNITRESTMLTGDLNIVDVEWIIQYRVVDPRAWLFNVKDKRRTIRDISQSVVNMLVGDRAILDVMRTEREPIEIAAVELMNDNFKLLGLGINVIAVKLQNIVPPVGVQDAFEDVNKAIQDMERFINEGQESYNAQIPRAQGEADKMIQIARGYATERVNNARGDTARFSAVYEEYRKNPAVTRERLYLEAMEDIFSAKENQALIDGELSNVLPIKTITGGMR